MLSTLRVRDKWLIFNMIPQLWADVKYHVPTGFGFSPKASGFYPFDDATALTGEGDVGDVVWLIQASAWNQTCHSTNHRCEALASLKGCFLCFCFSPPVFFHWAHHPPHSTILPHPKKTYEKRFTNTNNHPQFTQKISKLMFFLTKFTTLWTTTLWTQQTPHNQVFTKKEESINKYKTKRCKICTIT